MRHKQRRTPGPFWNGTGGSESVQLGGFDTSENNPLPSQKQELPPALDPASHRIVGAHWYGLTPNDDGGWEHIGALSAAVVAATARAMARRAAA